MQKDVKKDAKPDDSLSPEVQEVMRNLVSAIRVVKIYPSNNPIYSQSVKKCHDSLAAYLGSAPEYHVGVQKTHFTFGQATVGKDAQLNRAIAQDLFGKGIREMIFSTDLSEDELLTLCRGLALSTEELAMKSGISTILWEKGATHVKVTEAGLEEVITAKNDDGWEDKKPEDSSPEALAALKAAKEKTFTGRTLVLGDVLTDPTGFGASMVALAKETKAAHETVEDRLFALYQEAGKKIQQEHTSESEAMFEGLAKSVLSLDKPYRDGLIAGKLYRDLDAELAEGEGAESEQHLPSALHEVQTGRFSEAWNVQQVATLLKRSAAKKIAPSTPPPPAAEIESIPLPKDIELLVKDLAEYTQEEMAGLRTLSEAGMESDIIEAAARTLILLLPQVKNPQRAGGQDKALRLFSGVVHQLEDLLSYLLNNNRYDLATNIIKALNMPIDPEFKPRMTEALKKAATKSGITETIAVMRKHPKGSVEYQAAYDYLIMIDRKATEIMLELLAEEDDRAMRIFLLDLLKDLGKNQLVLLGEYLNDSRWYVVRNIVNIMGESRSEQAVAFLRKAADNRDVRIRQEVIKALITIGGKKAASVLVRFLRDQDSDVQMTAIHALAEMQGIGQEESSHLIDFLGERQLKKKDQEFTLEAIKTLGRIGAREAGEFLKGYTRIKWWKSRQLQTERRDAALRAIEEITRRQGDGGRAKR